MQNQSAEVNKWVEDAVYDTEALEKLYGHYFPRVHNFISVRVMNRNVADDLTSEVFEKVLDKLVTYRHEKGKFSTWLFTIAANMVTDYFRQSIKHPQESIELLLELPSKEPAIEERILAEEDKKSLLEALFRLTDRERNIIVLKFWWQLTNREIARLENMDEGYVAVILYRSIRKLRDLMRDR